jgi:uncharacterized phage infection (PIP) family protein YhgE
MTLHYRVDCTQGCGESLRLVDLTKHIKEKCPCVPVKCPFHECGCSFSGTRGEMEKHMEENSHGEFAMGIFKTAASAMEGQKQVISESVGEFKTLVESLVSIVGELKQQVESQNTKIQTLERIIQDSERTRQLNHDCHKDIMSNLNAKVDRLTTVAEETKDQTKKRARPGEGESSRTKYRNQQVARLKAENKELTNKLSSVPTSIAAASGTNNAEAGSSSDPVNVETDDAEPGASAGADSEANSASSSAANPLVVDVDAAADAGKRVRYNPTSPAYSPTSPGYSPTSPS